VELASTMFLGLAADIVKMSGEMRATGLVDSQRRDSQEAQQLAAL
jgi:hypothetical protein